MKTIIFFEWDSISFDEENPKSVVINDGNEVFERETACAFIQAKINEMEKFIKIIQSAEEIVNDRDK